MHAFLLIAALHVAGVVTAADEGRLHADFRTEGEQFHDSCASERKSFIGCMSVLFTDHPIHVAVGSLAPQNGFGFGGAFTYHYTPETWRISWDSDAVVAAPGGGWRAGTYWTFVSTPIVPPTQVVHAKPGALQRLTDYEHPIIRAYGQVISLPTVFFFGLGPQSDRQGQSVYGFKEGIVGAAGALPLLRSTSWQPLRLTLLGEMNERVPTLRSGSGNGGPSIETLYSEADAPGLTSQPATTQFGEGLRARPSVANGRLRFDYEGMLQQFVATDSQYSFRRWRVNLAHELLLYSETCPQTAASGAATGPCKAPTAFPTALATNGPNQCAADPKSSGCPISRNRVGSISFRLYASRSQVSGGSVVPFYFQQTLGGSDINGEQALASFDDYRFRAPHVFLIQEGFEHSLGTWPIGIFAQGDHGRVALQGDSLSSASFRHTFSAGLNVRAGGFPVITFAYGVGSSEGHHVIVVMSTSLLGGSNRPSLQ